MAQLLRTLVLAPGRNCQGACKSQEPRLQPSGHLCLCHQELSDSSFPRRQGSPFCPKRQCKFCHIAKNTPPPNHHIMLLPRYYLFFCQPHSGYSNAACILPFCDCGTTIGHFTNLHCHRPRMNKDGPVFAAVFGGQMKEFLFFVLSLVVPSHTFFCAFCMAQLSHFHASIGSHQPFQ